MEEEILAQPSVDFLTLALVQDNAAAHKLLKAHLAHTTDLLATLNEPAEHVAVLAGAEDSCWQVRANCLEYLDHHKIGWILTSASINLFPGLKKKKKVHVWVCVCVWQGSGIRVLS